MIPKRIFTIWLNESPDLPEIISHCIATQKAIGYEHRLITLENCDRSSSYVRECLEAKKWVKAVDYLRVHYLFTEGGIYLDADVEMIPEKNFDDLLNEKLFVGEEENGFISNAIIGAEQGHSLLEDYLGKVERNFRGSGDLVFQPGMFLWTELIKYASKESVKIFPPEWFLPWNHHSQRLLVTENTRCIHKFLNSWVTN